MRLWTGGVGDFLLATIFSINLPLVLTGKGICPPGSFPCNQTNQCVEQRRNCDGRRDCDDGSDEWHCEDEFRKKFWNKIFRKRPDEDREKQTKGCQLISQPDECNCSGQSLYCEHRQLDHVPFPLPKGLIEIDLSGSRIISITANDFPVLMNLETLILTSSEVRHVHKGAFRNLPEMKKLYLTGNRIRRIEDKTFSSCRSLRLLILSHNPLEELESDSFWGLQSLQELDMRNCRLQLLPSGVFRELTNLETLWLDGNLLSVLPDFIFTPMEQLVTLSLSKNKIGKLKEQVFLGLHHLKSLSLSSNVVPHLDSGHFGNMSSLSKLDLQGNGIRFIKKDTFLHLLALRSLNLKGNPLRKVEVGSFDHLQQLHYLYFDEFSFCSYALHVRVCEPQGDGISSVAHLLDNPLLRISVWIVAVLACVGNLLVLLGRLMVREPNRVHSFYIKNLALADLLMGVYLFAIAGYDVAFRGQYILHEERWRHSWQCNLCGFLSTLSSQASVVILTVITVDRYMSIVYPLTNTRRTMGCALVHMVGTWTFTTTLSFLPFLSSDYYGNEFYGTNGVCLALQIDKPYSRGWEYSTFVFCGLNMLAFFFILFAYVAMFFSITSSKAGLRSTQQLQERTIAKRFAFIVATDFLCWAPIILLKLLSMAGIPIDGRLNAWVAIFLLPVNSAINPIVYTLTTKMFKQQICRLVYSCRDGRFHPFSRVDLFKTSTRSSGSRSSKKVLVAALSENETSSKSVVLRKSPSAKNNYSPKTELL